MKPTVKCLDSSSPMARCFSWLKHHMPCLTGLELGLMLRVCLVTSRGTPGISTGLHANISLLHRRKLVSTLSYLGSRLAPICTILAGCSVQMCTTLASLSVLKTLDVEGMAGSSGVVGTQRLSSLSSALTTAIAASSMLSSLQSSARYVLASTVITPVGLGILSLRYA
jgi:hypothetical protein